ncbi:phosphatidylinositol-4-phosphate 5-Kinase [Cardiosporidium cionae]|uniref:Phosphatidylinositol-4-phosphate 5-Kinase n=1 Tax=Cardiosporidium cionae TaxID=476202 RepID=A0ABQ7JC58_9APIC|nr:phosphatidylinositol-4-phosphate 5-Kinase [Cardiosporidium cionae]|eukprot:KAF8821601.1 phosphatidylinositol-4-phosphate 5-Kinase [Cardiosporidium cionae]
MFYSNGPRIFEYIDRIFFEGLPSTITPHYGLFQVERRNRIKVSRSKITYVVMENLRFGFDEGMKGIHIFDLKGMGRTRYYNENIRPETAFGATFRKPFPFKGAQEEKEGRRKISAPLSPPRGVPLKGVHLPPERVPSFPSTMHTASPSLLYSRGRKMETFSPLLQTIHEHEEKSVMEEGKRILSGWSYPCRGPSAVCTPPQTGEGASSPPSWKSPRLSTSPSNVSPFSKKESNGLSPRLIGAHLNLPSNPVHMHALEGEAIVSTLPSLPCETPTKVSTSTLPVSSSPSSSLVLWRETKKHPPSPRNASLLGEKSSPFVHSFASTLIAEDLLSVSSQKEIELAIKEIYLPEEAVKANKIVLWDQNFREYTRGFPLFLLTSADKQYLNQAIYNDTTFLSRLAIVDYSLLLMIDEDSQRIRMGLIDYMRPYTWDKHVETIGKTILMRSGALPTVISPSDYSERFCTAMHTFFDSLYPTEDELLSSPHPSPPLIDRHTQLKGEGKGRGKYESTKRLYYGYYNDSHADNLGHDPCTLQRSYEAHTFRQCGIACAVYYR